MKKSELKEILELHAEWLQDESRGKRADLSGAFLPGADLFEANLSRADLSEANLSGARLSEAYLSKANLYKADLSRASLSRANLTNAKLFKVDLSGANLYRAKFGSFTTISGIGSNRYKIQIIPDRVLWGCKQFSFDEILDMKKEYIEEHGDYDTLKADRQLIIKTLKENKLI